MGAASPSMEVRWLSSQPRTCALPLPHYIQPHVHMSTWSPDCVDSHTQSRLPISHLKPHTISLQFFIFLFCCQFDLEFLWEGFVKQPRLTSNSEEVSRLRLLDPEMVSMSHHTQENLKDFFFYFLWDKVTFAMACMQKGEENFVALILSYFYVGFEDQNWVVRLAPLFSKHPCSLRHLSSLRT